VCTLPTQSKFFNNSYTHLHQRSPIFQRGSKSAKFCPDFRPHSHSERCGSESPKIKTNLYSIDVWALICRRLRASRAPNSEKRLLKYCPKVRQFEKRLHNSAAHGQIVFKFRKMVLCGSRKAAELWKPTSGRIQDGNDAQIFNLWTPISLERLKLQTSNLVWASTTRSNFDGIQKNYVKGDVTQLRWPIF